MLEPSQIARIMLEGEPRPNAYSGCRTYVADTSPTACVTWSVKFMRFLVRS